MTENAANTECKLLLMCFTDPHHGAHSVMFQVSADRYQLTEHTVVEFLALVLSIVEGRCMTTEGHISL